MAPPSGTLTFLFTDVEGSSRLWDEHPKLMEQVLARHDELVRYGLAEHGGYVFATGGDGFAAAFSTARNAIESAVGIQLALRKETWPADVDLQVRIGVHSGAAHERGGDYFGPAVNKAARIMAAAHGGQVLASNVAIELAGPVQSVKFHALGTYRLSGIKESVALYQVTHELLNVNFSPPRASDSVPGNVPTPTGRLFGREAQVSEVMHALDGSRLVTVFGPGGAGKTSLALRVAADCHKARRATWWCELAPVESRAGVLAAVAASLGITAAGEPFRDIVNGLRFRDALVVLDNAEHVLTTVEEFAATILAACPNVNLLVTSREPLGVPEERVLAISGLTLEDAVELFQARSTGALARAEKEAVEAVCQQLDCLPLGIELAAARSRTISPTEMAVRLRDNWALLRRRHPTHDRHQSLESVVDWSYRLLEVPEQRRFCWLCVFSGGFDLQMAEDVAGRLSLRPAEAIEALDSLVNRSLVVSERLTVGTTRFRVLETMRHYGLDRLADCNDLRGAREAHAAIMTGVAMRIGETLLSSDEAVARARVVTELDNLRSAAALYFETDADAARVFELAVPLIQFDDPTPGAQASDWLLRAIEQWGVPHHRYSSAALGAVAWSLAWRGRAEAAKRFANQALGLEDRPGMHMPPRGARLVLANCVWASSHYREAVDLFRQAAAAYRASAPQLTAFFAASQVFTGTLPSDSDFDEIVRNAENLNKGLEMPSATASRLIMHAIALIHSDPQASIRGLEEGGAIAARVGNKMLEGIATRNLALAYALFDEPGAAIHYAVQALGSFVHTGEVQMAIVTIRFATVALARYGAIDAAVMLDAAIVTSGVASRRLGIERRAWQSATADARTRLGERAYDNAIVTGRRLGPEQIIRRGSEILAELSS